MQSKSEGEDVDCLQYAWMFLTCSEVVQDTVDGSSLGNYHISPFSQKLHHTCNNYRLQQPKINKSLRGKSGWEAMIIKRLLCPHANVLLAQVALRDCPNELYPLTQTCLHGCVTSQHNVSLLRKRSLRSSTHDPPQGLRDKPTER